VSGWAEIADRPPKLRDRSRNRRSPHDGHGAAKRRRSHASPNAIAARPVRGAMFSARRSEPSTVEPVITEAEYYPGG